MEKYQWKNIKNPKISFPIVADDLGNVARMYGMLMPAASTTRTVRTVFFIDPEGTIRAMLLYPLTTGRNIDEIMRLLLALQAYDKTGNATPANWMPGDPQILPAPQTMPLAQQRLDDSKKGAVSCLDWYICFTGENKQDTVTKAAAQNKETSKARENTQAKENIASINEIIDMIGKTGIQKDISAPNASPAAKNTQNSSGKVIRNVKKTSGSENSGGGIMEQNRLLFDFDNDLGIKNEYFIKRDYPNMGL